MSILDISNWTIDEINNSIDAFKDTSLTDIGMVNCDIDSINIVGGITTATLWIDENIGIDGYTGTAPLKIYKEDKVEIKLNNPLLEGDTIEVIDGKLCHVHRYEKFVLDGSEDETIYKNANWSINNTTAYFFNLPNKLNTLVNRQLISDKFATKEIKKDTDDESIGSEWNTYACYIRILSSRLSTQDVNGFKQWLQTNPTTIIYELASPYYEDITPLQSSIILKTFNESSMIINTNLPIETNVSYRTNVPSISTLSNRVAEVSESDNVIHNLINIIDDEVDE